jgi:hypothetical protein
MLVRPRRIGDDVPTEDGWGDHVIETIETIAKPYVDAGHALLGRGTTAPTVTVNDPLYRPHLVTPTTIEAVRDALAQAWPDGSRASIAVLCAQIMIETGLVHLHNWNLGNVKRVPGQPWTMLPHVWEIIGGQKVVFDPPHPQTHFRAFATIEEGVAAYLETMRRRFASAWPAVEAGDPRGFAHALKLAHYYTASEADYAKALVERFSKLAA